jgi:hypothetical protein
VKETRLLGKNIRLTLFVRGREHISEFS